MDFLNYHTGPIIETTQVIFVNEDYRWIADITGKTENEKTGMGNFHANFQDIINYLKEYGFGNNYPSLKFREHYINPLMYSFLFWNHLRKKQLT